MFIFFVITLLTLSVWWYRKKVWIYPDNFPPGPRAPLPILGDALSLGKDIPVGVDKLHEKYGPIIGKLSYLRKVTNYQFMLLERSVHGWRAGCFHW